MKIGNRMHDVIKLRSNIMQELLSLVIKPEWKKEFKSKLEFYNENNLNAQIYAAPYDKIRVDGLDNYDIKDMDVTLIRAILIHNKDLLGYKISKELKNAIEDVKDDRNLTNHSSENETDNELYLRALVSLCDIRKLVRSVDKDSNIPDSEELREFRQKNERLISELMNKIDYERFDLVSKYIRFEKDTDMLLKEKDDYRRFELYSSIIDSYLRLRIINHNYFMTSLEFDAYIYERGLDLGRDGARWHYGFIGDLEKYNSDFAKTFQNMHKDDRAKNLETIREYFEKLNIFFKDKSADSESTKKNFELIEQLGFKICKDEHGAYLIADSKKN